eukprot:m.375524 g.375524  ORF g.375524 m.375524 type:complete len:97 (-) comp20009_c0_seq5:75-365(-)
MGGVSSVRGEAHVQLGFLRRSIALQRLLQLLQLTPEEFSIYSDLSKHERSAGSQKQANGLFGQPLEQCGALTPAWLRKVLERLTEGNSVRKRAPRW